MGKDIVKEIYIHQHKINFLNKKNDLSLQISKENIRNQYRKHLKEAKARETAIKEKEKEFLNNESFFNYIMTTQKEVTPETISKMSQMTKNMLQSTYGILFSKQRTTEQLDQYITLLKNYVESFKEQDENYITYLSDKYLSENIDFSTLLQKDVVLLGANPSAVSAFNDLENKIKILENFSSNISKQKTVIDEVITKKDGKKVHLYSSILGSLTQLFVLILGGLGETGGEEVALGTINQYMQEYTNNLNNCFFSIESTGTQKKETGGMAKPDYLIKVKKKDGLIEEINLQYKFSAKGVKLKDIKGKKKHITFETSSLSNFLLYLPHAQQYMFLNNLYFKIKQPLLTQYIAARYSLQGITGGDSSLVFVRFLDTTITISELFEDLINNDSSYFTLRYQSPINRIKKENENSDVIIDSDDEKNEEAWKRSKETKALLLQIKTQLWQQFK